MTEQTFADEIEEEVGGETIEAIVIGAFGWDGYNDNHRVPAEKQGVPLTWQEARQMLEYEYAHGYGAPECHAIAAYTPTRVIMVSQYDGLTEFFHVQRNPVPHSPEMPGG